jgi:hypothetical protein
MYMKLPEAVVEGIKEFIRTFILGMLIPIGAALGVIQAGINVELGTFLIQWNLALAVLASGAVGSLNTAIASAFDKWLHEKEIKTPLDLKSLDVLKK